jgi:hypothetical protein
MSTASAVGLTVIIPGGGGQATQNITPGLFTFNSPSQVSMSVNAIDAVLHVRISKTSSIVTNGVGYPQFGNNGTGTAIGMTLFASSGTTITYTILAMAH